MKKISLLAVLIAALSYVALSQDTLQKNDGTILAGKIKSASLDHVIILTANGQTLEIPGREVKLTKFGDMKNAVGQGKATASGNSGTAAPDKGPTSAGSYRGDKMPGCKDCGIVVFNNKTLPDADAKLEVRGKGKAWYSISTFDDPAKYKEAFPHSLDVPEGEYEWQYTIKGKTLGSSFTIHKGQTVVIPVR